MWLMAQYGFYSIVRKGENDFHIRARAKNDLENLRMRAQIPKDVVTSPFVDYRYRLIVDNE